MLKVLDASGDIVHDNGNLNHDDNINALGVGMVIIMVITHLM